MPGAAGRGDRRPRARPGRSPRRRRAARSSDAAGPVGTISFGRPPPPSPRCDGAQREQRRDVAPAQLGQQRRRAAPAARRRSTWASSATTVGSGEIAGAMTVACRSATGRRWTAPATYRRLREDVVDRDEEAPVGGQRHLTLDMQPGRAALGPEVEEVRPAVVARLLGAAERFDAVVRTRREDERLGPVVLDPAAEILDRELLARRGRTGPRTRRRRSSQRCSPAPCTSGRASARASAGAAAWKFSGCSGDRSSRL